MRNFGRFEEEMPSELRHLGAAAVSSRSMNRRSHPHFDDRGALDWFDSYSEALAAAKRDGKIVFVEYGRER